MYVNLQPNGAKALYRVKKSALEEYLEGTSAATVEAVVTEAEPAVCAA